MPGDVPRNLAMLHAAFGSGPLFAPTDDDLITYEGVELISGYEHASTPERFVIVKQPPHRDAFIELCRRVRGGRIVELGIAEGGSTVLAALAAEPSALLAVDIEPEPLEALEEFIAARALGARVHTRYGIDQGDRDRLARTVDEAIGTGPLDLVVDDASHVLDLTRTSFEVLFPRLAPGGLYAIEDWNADHVFQEAMIEHFRTASTEKRAELARSLREAATSSPTPDPPARRPLLDLAVELTLARACDAEEAIAEVVITRYWLLVRRGPGALDGTTFRLADVAHDHFGYLR
ncbi:MAG TPA: class I SAM-dependent methyltransferase [Acidimicrobiales bacterium]|nr:class I SAM-dependent methyltransferase [Acidimicrobiales bacterium]